MNISTRRFDVITHVVETDTCVYHVLWAVYLGIVPCCDLHLFVYINNLFITTSGREFPDAMV